MKVIYADREDVLELGYEGENNRTEVLFYYGDLAQEFPGGTVLLQVKRPGETTKYDITEVVLDGEYALWFVSGYDCGVKGFGECQLIYTTHGSIAKQKIWKTHVERSVEGADSSIPPDWEDAETRLITATGEVVAAMTEAQTFVENAMANADAVRQDAANSALTAEGYATGTQRGVPVEEGIYFQNSAKYYKEQAEAVMEEYEAMTANATTLEAGSQATVSIDRTGTAPVLRVGVPQGIRGEKGDTGDSGVYVGSVEPTDPSVNVWIDPNGSATG